MAYTLMDREKELISALNTITEGEKITLVGINDFGFTQSIQTRFCEVKIAENDYRKVIDLIHKPKNKRKHYILPSDYYKDIIILYGWIDIDTDAQFETYVDNNRVVKQSINTAFDKTFLKDIALIWEKETIYSNVKI